MKLIESPLYNNNLERIVNRFTFSELLGKRVFVTGGLGLIGSSIVDLLLKINEHPEGKIDISVGGRNKEKFFARYGKETEKLHFIHYEARKALELNNDKFD